MIVGDPRAWTARFVTLQERLLRRILHVWPACVALLPGQPEEDTITINLVAFLLKDAVVRRICYFVDYHRTVRNPPRRREVQQGPDRRRISAGSGARTLRRLRMQAPQCHLQRNTQFTRHALREKGHDAVPERKICGGLPLGCMLGYVMDGDLPFALTQVSSAIDANASQLGVMNGAPPSQAVPGIERFSTLHQRASTTVIELRHALLPFSVAKGASEAVPQAELAEPAYQFANRNSITSPRPRRRGPRSPSPPAASSPPPWPPPLPPKQRSPRTRWSRRG